MIGDLIAIGLFSSGRYVVPPSRQFAIPLIRQRIMMPPKYPDELLPYQVDWSARLDGSTIKAMTIETVTGVALPTRAIFDDTTTSFWLGGGRSGFLSIAFILLTTDAGEQVEEFFSILSL